MGKQMMAVMVAVTLCAGLVQGAAPDSLWSKTFGGAADDGCHAMVELADGSLALAGTSRSWGDGGMEYWLVMTDRNGDSLWSRTYDAGDCNTLIRMSDGGLALGGTRNVKIDTIGNVRVNQEVAIRSYSMVEAGHGDLVSIGWSANGAARDDFMVQRFPGWTEYYGGSGDEEGYGIVAIEDGGFLLAGSATSFGSDKDVWIVRIDGHGAEIWARNYVRAGPDVCYAIARTDDGGFMLAGETTRRGQVADSEFLLMKVAENGDLVWTRNYGKNTRQEGANAITKTYDGGFLLGGLSLDPNTRNRNMWVLRVNSEGDSLWSRALGGRADENCFSVIQTADSGYAVAGYTYSFGSGNGDYWLVKLAAESVGAVEGETVLEPGTFGLLKAYPNPFNGVVNLSFQATRPGYYALQMVDPTGRSVGRLFEGYAGFGEQKVMWNAEGMPAGEYFVKVSGYGGINMVKSVVLLK